MYTPSCDTSPVYCVYSVYISKRYSKKEIKTHKCIKIKLHTHTQCRPCFSQYYLLVNLVGQSNLLWRCRNDEHRTINVHLMNSLVVNDHYLNVV